MLKSGEFFTWTMNIRMQILEQSSVLNSTSTMKAENFAEIVQLHPVLYDTSHPEHKGALLKKSWDFVAAQAGETVLSK